MFQSIAAMRAYLRVHLAARIDSERGVTMVEYGIILGLVAVAAVVTIGLVGDKIAEAWQSALDADWP